MFYITYEFVPGEFYRAADNYLTGKESTCLYNSKYRKVNLVMIGSVITHVTVKEIYFHIFSYDIAVNLRLQIIFFLDLSK